MLRLIPLTLCDFALKPGLRGAQASAGKMLRVVTDWAVGRITYVQQLQLTMAVVLACGLVVMGLHAHITAKFHTNRDEINDAVIAQAKRMARRKELLSRSDAGVTTGCRPGLKT